MLVISLVPLLKEHLSHTWRIFWRDAIAADQPGGSSVSGNHLVRTLSHLEPDDLSSRLCSVDCPGSRSNEFIPYNISRDLAKEGFEGHLTEINPWTETFVKEAAVAGSRWF